MKTFVLATLFLAVVPMCLAQPPDSLWSHIYHRSSYDDFGDMVQTADSGFVIVGSTRLDSVQFGGWMIKTNFIGDTAWTRIHGSGHEILLKVRQLPDRGYIMAGTTSPGSTTKLWLLRTDSQGDTLWSRTYQHREIMYCQGLELLPDEGFLLAGLGVTYVPGGDIDTLDAWVLRTDSNGDSLWMRVFNWERFMTFESLDTTADGGFILSGLIIVPGTDSEGWLVKLSAQGDTLWTRAVPGISGVHDSFSDASPTNDGGFVATGVTGGTLDPVQLWLVRFDSTGSMVWQTDYGHFGGDAGYSVAQAGDGGFLVGGTQWVDSLGFWILKTDSSGTLEWSLMPSIAGIPGQSGYACYQVMSVGGGEFVAAGQVTGFAMGVIKYGTLTDVGGGPPTVPDSFALMPSVYPNPFNPITTIQWYQTRSGPVTVVVYDLLGRLVATLTDRPFGPGKHFLQFNGQSLSSGSYFISVQTPDYLYRRRVLLLK